MLSLIQEKQVDHPTNSNFRESKELAELAAFYQRNSQMLQSVQILSNKADILSKESIKYAVQQMNSKSLCVELSDEQQESYIQDINNYIRIISYCLITDSILPMEESLTEINKSDNNYPSELYFQALNYIKENHNLPDFMAEQVNSYIDYIQASLI